MWGVHAFHCGGWCPIVLMIPIFSGCDAKCLCQTTTCRGRDHTGGRSETHYEQFLLEWWKRHPHPGAPITSPQHSFPMGCFPRWACCHGKALNSCLSQSSAISPVQAKPIFIALKATEPNALVLMLQVKIPETVFHLKMDKKMRYTSCCCSPVNYSGMHHYLGEYKKVSFLVGAVSNAE